MHINESNKRDAVNSLVNLFISTTNGILEKYYNEKMKLKITMELQRILVNVKQIFIFDIIPSCQTLAYETKFYSLSILCRSILDLTIQLKWITSLDGEQKKKAIEAFLSFDGVGISEKRKFFNDWKYAITKKSTRDLACELKIDAEFFSLESRSREEPAVKLTTFDYLSKATHFNPRFIRDCVGFNENKLAGFSEKYLEMALISFDVIIYCFVSLTSIFIEHGFYSEIVETPINILITYRQSAQQIWPGHQ